MTTPADPIVEWFAEIAGDLREAGGAYVQGDLEQALTKLEIDVQIGAMELAASIRARTAKEPEPSS